MAGIHGNVRFKTENKHPSSFIGLDEACLDGGFLLDSVVPFVGGLRSIGHLHQHVGCHPGDSPKRGTP